jgi:glycerate 2-kinase
MSVILTQGAVMKVLVAPDSFKGSLSAAEAAQAMAQGVRKVWPDADIRLFPVADGGEGTLDVVLTLVPGERHRASVADAAGRRIEVEYGVLADGAAIIETARIIGLTLPGVLDVAVEQRTTAGVGESIRHCLASGIRRFMIGLGGSATNDGGIGMLQALGMRTTEQQGGLAALDFAALDPRLAQSHITILSDVANPLCGPQGATAMYGPQKGVQPQQIAQLDACLKRFGDLADAWLGRTLSLQPGTGAAGGLGYALQLLGGEHRSGAGVLLALSGFDAALQGADLVLTGEGRSDGQTPEGKAPWAVAQRAVKAGVPVVLMSGSIEDDARAQLESQFTACHTLTSATITPEMAMRDAAGLLEERAAEAISGVPVP